ncbi:MAG: glycosyltransferase family 4 protein [Ardenticatenaceae bacterium]|nr:glycosyltransferase family 4 protein [Ardenticatenaceae bacterium]
MTRIRVLQLISGVDIGEQSGGAESHALKVAARLDKTTFESSVFSMWYFGGVVEESWIKKLKENNLDLYGLTPWNNKLKTNVYKSFLRLWETVSTFRPHIINSHSERGDWMNMLVNVFHPIHPYAIRTVHIDRQWSTHPLLGNCLNKMIFPVVFDKEICVSQTIYHYLSSPLRREEQINLCYNGIDKSSFEKTEQLQSKLPPGIPQGRPRIGVIGRLAEQKGHSDLLDAMKIVLQKQSVHLVIIGDGPLKTSLQTKALQDGIISNVHFLGVRNDVDMILSHLDVFVLPSLWEGFPTVLLEAMSKEVPVIATNVSGSRELVKTGETGWLVSPSCPNDLAQAIETAVTNILFAKQMARQAKQHASQYTLQAMLACYESIYRQFG